MILDNIHLITELGQYYLIDNYTQNILLISKRAYDVLMAVKEKQSFNYIKNRFGNDDVDEILRQLNEMENRNILNMSRNDLAQKAKNFIDGIPDREVEVVEGVFMITQRCNMSCKYCYGDEGQFGAAGIMNEEMAEKYFRIFLELGKKNKIQKVKFLGGEPLLNLDIMKFIISLWEKWKPLYEEKELYFSFTTNGTLFTPKLVKYLKEKNIGVTISLDGPKTIHDENRISPRNKSTYEQIMEGIKLLKCYDIGFSIRATVSSKAPLDEIYQFFKTENFHIVHIIPADFPISNPNKEYQWGYDNYKDFIEKEIDICNRGCLDILNNEEDTFEAKQMRIQYNDIKIRQGEFPFKCGAGWWIVAFSTDGYIYPCHRLVGNSNFRIGNYIEGLDKNKVAEIYRELFSVSQKCHLCYAFSNCGGRCLAQKVDANGRYTEVDKTLCDIYKEKMQKTLPLVCKIQSKK